MPLNLLLRKNLAFFIPVFIFLLTGIIFLLLFPKDLIHLTQNGWYHPFFDEFFRYGTYLGDGLIFLPVALTLAFVRWRFFLGLAMAAVITLFSVGILKNLVFENRPRPVKYFELKNQLRLVEGEEVHSSGSFPSGHTTTAFSCFSFLAFVVRRHWVKILFFVAAAVAGYSRIYLSQHFLEDVIAGAALGTLIGVVSYFLMHRLHWGWSDRRMEFRRKPSA